MEEVGENAEEKIRVITECVICMSVFTDPRMLPCIHTFCFECLKRTSEADEKKPGDEMPCPLCRKEFIIPKDGINGVQKNLFMENLLEFRRTLEVGSATIICDMCNIGFEGKTGQIPTATMRCAECQDNYCDSCVKVRQFQKLSRNHSIVNIRSSAKSEKKVSTEATTQFENCAIVMGLADGRTIKNDVIKINLHRSLEISSEQMPATMQNDVFAAVYCNTVYVSGIGDDFNEIWKYTQMTGWKKCAFLVQERCRHGAAFIDEVLYICGGIVTANLNILDNVEAYNAVDDKCTTVGELVHCVMGSGNCVPFRDSIYIFGGNDKDHKALNCVQVYNTKQNTCTILTKPMPCGCGFFRAVLWNASVILFGYETCLMYNIETETWLDRNQFKTVDVHSFGLILENERIFVLGGTGSSLVRFIPLRNIIDDVPIEWKILAKNRRKPVYVFACANLRFSA